MSDDQFNLSALVREVCDTSTIADPETLAKEVWRRIARNERDEALGQALVTVLRVYISRSRGSLSVPDGQGERATHTRTAVGGSNRSRMVTGIRDLSRRMLRERINVGPKQYKFLVDCTALDLRYSASVNDEHARSNVASAERKRAIADLIDESGVDTVGQLPPDALDTTLGVAA